MATDPLYNLTKRNEEARTLADEGVLAPALMHALHIQRDIIAHLRASQPDTEDHRVIDGKCVTCGRFEGTRAGCFVPPQPATDVDPGDSASLQALREAIDEHLAWDNQEDEDRGDYVARVRQVGQKLRPATETGDPIRAALDAERALDPKERFRRMVERGLVDSEGRLTRAYGGDAEPAGKDPDLCPRCQAEAPHDHHECPQPEAPPVEGVSDEEMTTLFDSYVDEQVGRRALYNLGASRSSAAKDARIAELERKLSRIYALVHAPENVAISLERVRGELEPTP